MDHGNRDPVSDDARLVLGDALLAAGPGHDSHPIGELVAVQAALAKTPEDPALLPRGTCCSDHGPTCAGVSSSPCVMLLPTGTTPASVLPDDDDEEDDEDEPPPSSVALGWLESSLEQPNQRPTASAANPKT